MRKGAVGLILIVLLTLILLIVIFVSSKFILPNPQTIEADQKITKDAQDAVNKYQQKNIQNQSVDLSN